MQNHFDIPEQIIEAFTMGDCGYLALALHSITGYSLVTASVDDPDDWVHVAVLTPDARVLDIQGHWDVQDWLDRWLAGSSGEYHFLHTWDMKSLRLDIEDSPRHYTDVDPERWARSVAALALLAKV